MENEKSNQEIEKIIEEAIRELVGKMNIDCEMEIKKIVQEEGEDLICNIKTAESNYLIGQYGVNLQALQHIARVIIRKKTDTSANFVLDVNSYRQEKNESVAALAKSMAQKAILEGRSIILRPMSPYERRLVHMELAQDEKVKTASVGEGEDRRVEIKPASLV